MQTLKKYLPIVLFTLSATSLHAQRGCFHSPEAPTAALLLVGGAGISFGSSLLARLIRKHRQN